MERADGTQRTPSIRRDMACIEGGCLKDGTIWTAPIKVIDGKEFITLLREDRKLASFLGADLTASHPMNGSDLFSILQDARNNAVDKKIDCMQRANQDQTCGTAQKRPRAELYDDICAIVEVTVTANGREETMRMLSTPRRNNNVSVELTEHTLKILLAMNAECSTDEKASGSQDAVPELKNKDTRWNRQRACVYCRYFDGEARKWRTKCFKVKHSDDPEMLKARIEEADNLAQEFFDLQHCPVRAPGSASEDD